MQSQRDRTSTLPSALVLRGLCADHAGDPPSEALEQAGFTRSQVEGYVQRCAARLASFAPPEPGRRRTAA
jgi:hypothetical protein